MWKRLVIIALALSPLGYRTIDSAITAYEGGEANSVDAGPTRVWSDEPEQTHRLTQTEGEYLRKIHQAASRGYLVVSQAWEPNESLDGVIAKWTAVSDSARLVTTWPALPTSGHSGEPGSAAVPSRDMPLDEVELKQLIGELDGELRAMRNAKQWVGDCLTAVQPFDKSGPLFASIQDRQRLIHGSIDSLDVMRARAGQLLLAVQSFAREDYAGAEAALAKWKDAPPLVVALRARCNFLVRAKQVLDHSLEALGGEDADRLRKVEVEFLKLSRQVDAHHIAKKEAQLWNRCVATRQRIKAYLNVLDLGPPVELGSWLSKVEALRAKDETVRDIIREVLLKGLFNRLPEKKSAYGRVVQFAKMKGDPVVYVGVFKVNPAGDWYDFWSSAKDGSEMVPGNPIGKRNLLTGPEQPPMIGAAEAYRTAVATLRADPANREHWQQLQEVCLQWQTKIDNFCDAYRLDSTVDVDVASEGQLALDVLAHWPRVESLLRD